MVDFEERMTEAAEAQTKYLRRIWLWIMFYVLIAVSASLFGGLFNILAALMSSGGGGSI